MDSPPAPTTTTTILDLNDERLLDVFQYFDIYELPPLVDVCRRFRQISQRHFASMPIDGWKYKTFSCDLFRNRKILPLRFNRIFGPLMRSISLDKCYSRMGPRVDSPEYEMNMIQLLNTYCCSKTLIELTLIKWNLTSEVTDAMQPWFQRLERLRIERCELSESFLQQPFGKLTSFSCNYYMQIDEIGKFLSSNPQLKQIKFFDDSFDDRIFPYIADKIEEIGKFVTSNPQLKQIKFFDDSFDDRMFQYIADHVPGIESIAMTVLDPRTGASNMQCLGKLSELKLLKMYAPYDFISAVLREISGANIPLQKLHLVSMCESILMPLFVDQLVDEIAKLRMLKALRWDGVPRFNRGHIIQLYENLTELSELCLETSILHFDGYFYLNAELILEIVRNARKLQSLYCFTCKDLSAYREDREDRSLEEKCLINAKTYTEMVRLVEQRQEKLHLSVILGSYGYAANIPPELTKYHADTLTLAVTTNYKYFAEKRSMWR